MKNEKVNDIKIILEITNKKSKNLNNLEDVKMTFGLQPHHIETIEKELERFGNRELDAKYVKYIWEKLGKELAWEPFTLALYYFKYLERRRSFIIDGNTSKIKK